MTFNAVCRYRYSLKLVSMFYFNILINNLILINNEIGRAPRNVQTCTVKSAAILRYLRFKLLRHVSRATNTSKAMPNAEKGEDVDDAGVAPGVSHEALPRRSSA